MENTEKLESTLFKVRNDNEHLEKQIRSVDAEQRAEAERDRTIMKRNTLEMKKLRMQIEELKVRLQRQQMVDEKAIQETVQQVCGDREIFNGLNGQELIQQAEAQVIELNNKCQSLSHSLHISKRNLTENEKLLREMIERCRDDDLPTEADCLQHIRNLENEQQKVVRNTEESESAKNKFKIMIDHLRKKQASEICLLRDLKDKKVKELTDDDIGIKAKSDSENRFESESELELQRLEEGITMIKETTGCCDFDDIDYCFLEQKSTMDDLLEMKKKGEKRLNELKEEKRDIASKMSLVKGADTLFSQSKEELSLAKCHQKEQEKRCETAREELYKLNSVSRNGKNKLLKLIQKLNPKANTKELNNMSIGQLSVLFEKMTIRTFNSANNVWAAKVRRKGYN